MGKWDRRETYRREARIKGYRSRAAFKLKEIEKRFLVLKSARRIVDLCCAPGSWLQVIVENCNEPNCRIVGIDKAYVKPVSGVEIIRSAIDAHDLSSKILESLGGPANVVLSDCSPKLTGNKTLDRERQLWLAQLSLSLASETLEKDGHFVTKVFHSAHLRELETHLKSFFRIVKSFKPQSSFKRSPEMYLIAKEFYGNSTTNSC